METLPNEMVMNICNEMRLEDLSKYVLSSKRMHEVCDEVLRKKKKEEVGRIKELAFPDKLFSQATFTKSGSRYKIYISRRGDYITIVQQDVNVGPLIRLPREFSVTISDTAYFWTINKRKFYGYEEGVIEDILDAGYKLQ